MHNINIARNHQPDYRKDVNRFHAEDIKAYGKINPRNPETKGIIKQTINAELVKPNQLLDKVECNNNKIIALGMLKTVLGDLASAANVIRSPSDGVQQNNLAAKINSLSITNSNVDPSTFLQVETKTTADIGQHTIQITNLATASMTQSAGVTMFASNVASVVAVVQTSGQFTAGTFNINGFPVTLAAGNALTDVEAAINAQTSNTNVIAKVVQVGSDYMLRFSLANPSNTISISDPSNVLNNLIPFVSRVTSVVTAVQTPGQFTAGTFTINGVPITLNTNDTLNTVVGKINALTPSTSVKASILTANSGAFIVQLQSMKTGLDNAMAIVDLSNVLNGLIPTTPTQSAQDAFLTVDNVDATSSTNTVEGLIDGVSLTLKGPTANNHVITLNIEQDVDAIVKAVTNFVEKYNAFIRFNTEQTARENDKINFKKTAHLGNEPFLRKTFATLTSVVNNGAIPNTLNLSSLYEIGIEFAEKATESMNYNNMNTLVIDNDKLVNAITNSYADFRKVLDFEVASNSPNFIFAERGNALKLGSFAIDVNPLGLSATLIYDGNSSPLTFIPMNQADPSLGGTIIANANSPLAGFVIVYLGTGETTSFTVTQGIADRLYNAVSMINSIPMFSGLRSSEIDTEIRNIRAKDAQLSENVLREFEQVERNANFKIGQFAEAEAATEKARRMGDYMRINQDVANRR